MNKRSEYNNKCRHENKLTLLRHDSKTKVTFSLKHAVSPLRLPFSSARLMFCIIRFSKQSSSSSKQWFHWGILRVILPVNTARN